MKPKTRYAAYLVLITGGLCYLSTMERHLPSAQVLEHRSLDAGQREIVILSDGYRLDRYYPSMKGPSSNHGEIRLQPASSTSGVLFLTGIRSEVVDGTGQDPLSPEYFCHANLTLSHTGTSPAKHNAGFDPPLHADWRLFTLVPGKLDIQLPDGFGLPIRTDTRLDYFTMTLNQNDGKPVNVRIKTHLKWTTQSEDIRPLFRRAVYVYQQHAARPTDATAFVHTHAGEQCAQSSPDNQKSANPSTFAQDDAHPGASCCVRNASADGVMFQFGSENTIHWMVPPGRHIYRTEVTRQIKLPYPTTAHYVTGHLHPYARSMRLTDMETGETLFEIVSSDFEDLLGVASMTEWRSEEGVLIQPDGRYELMAEYDNPTDQAIDAMAILYLYLAESPEVGSVVKLEAKAPASN